MSGVGLGGSSVGEGSFQRPLYNTQHILQKATVPRCNESPKIVLDDQTETQVMELLTICGTRPARITRPCSIRGEVWKAAARPVTRLGCKTYQTLHILPIRIKHFKTKSEEPFL